MRFRDCADERLLDDLRDASVLTPDIASRIHAAMGHPENATLDEFLLAGADHIPETEWITWLIRRHDCHRFGRVRLEESEIGGLPLVPPAEPNRPYRSCRDGSLLVARFRPLVSRRCP